MSGIGLNRSEQIRRNSARKIRTHTHTHTSYIICEHNPKLPDLVLDIDGGHPEDTEVYFLVNHVKRMSEYESVCRDSVPGEHGAVRFMLFLMCHCTDIQRCQVHSQQLGNPLSAIDIAILLQNLPSHTNVFIEICECVIKVMDSLLSSCQVENTFCCCCCNLISLCMNSNTLLHDAFNEYTYNTHLSLYKFIPVVVREGSV